MVGGQEKHNLLSNKIHATAPLLPASQEFQAKHKIVSGSTDLESWSSFVFPRHMAALGGLTEAR